jgi:hypothetical protein
LADVPAIGISLKGDTAFEDPPMLDMAIEMYQQDVASAADSLSVYVKGFAAGQPDVVSVGEIREEQRSNGYLVYFEFKEDCGAHRNGAKTRMRGFARRGATMLDFSLVIALDSAATMAIASEILANFDKLDIAALTE